MYNVRLPPNSRIDFDGITYITYGDYSASGQNRLEAMTNLRKRIAIAEFCVPSENDWQKVVIDRNDLIESDII